MKDNTKTNLSRKRILECSIVIISISIIGFFANMSSTSTNIYNSKNSLNQKERKDDEYFQTKSIKENKIAVSIIDFSVLTRTEIRWWCNTMELDCIIDEKYSDTVEKGDFISQSISANETAYQRDRITIYFSLGKKLTMEQQNAIKKAESYLVYSAFSRKGLIEQLKFEGFSTENSTFAVDELSIDWNEQAEKKAKSYLKYFSFSKKSLIDQLKSEGFTTEQAQYGVTQNGY